MTAYPDILINDNAQNRNQYGYPLNIGIARDGQPNSRNVWYAIQEREDAPTHQWILENHLSTAPSPPEVFVSDRNTALEAVVPCVFPQADHIVCLHHLDSNVAQNLRPVLCGDWDDFQREFWAIYRAVSPEDFDRQFQALITRFPAAAQYLQNELYPIWSRWAWAWVSTRFTAGVRTNGRCEVENRINKLLGGPKVPFTTLFDRLNARTDEQTARDLIATRQVRWTAGFHG